MQDNKNSQMAYQMLALYFLKWVRVGIQSRYLYSFFFFFRSATDTVVVLVSEMSIMYLRTNSQALCASTQTE